MSFLPFSAEKKWDYVHRLIHMILIIVASYFLFLPLSKYCIMFLSSYVDYGTVRLKPALIQYQPYKHACRMLEIAAAQRFLRVVGL